MNHEMMAGPSGTFTGHFGPGIVFIFLALWWIFDIMYKGLRKPGSALERSLFIPTLKIVGLFVGGFLEIPNSGWYPMDWVMGWHHTTVYMAFALSGVVDILARKDILTARATYLAFAGASFIGGLLFLGHGIGPGVEGTCHSIVMILFFSVSIFTVLEVVCPDWNFEWFRIASKLGLGTWFCITAWAIFRSGWDLHDHVKEAHVWLLFSWMILGVATFTTFASILANKKWGDKVN